MILKIKILNASRLIYRNITEILKESYLRTCYMRRSSTFSIFTDNLNFQNQNYFVLLFSEVIFM